MTARELAVLPETELIDAEISDLAAVRRQIVDSGMASAATADGLVGWIVAGAPRDRSQTTMAEYRRILRELAPVGKAPRGRRRRNGLALVGAVAGTGATVLAGAGARGGSSGPALAASSVPTAWVEAAAHGIAGLAAVRPSPVLGIVALVLAAHNPRDGSPGDIAALLIVVVVSETVEYRAETDIAALPAAA